MRLLETAKFRKQRGKLHTADEKKDLQKIILQVMADPGTGKKLNGQLAPFHFCRCTIAGRPQRLIYGPAADALVLFSIGPRQGICKP